MNRYFSIRNYGNRVETMLPFFKVNFKRDLPPPPFQIGTYASAHYTTWAGSTTLGFSVISWVLISILWNIILIPIPNSY